MALMAYFPLDMRTQPGMFAGRKGGGGERRPEFDAGVGKLDGREGGRVVDGN